MSHFIVIVATNKSQNKTIDEILEPFWELDLSDDEMKEDDRAIFEVVAKSGEIKAYCENIVKDLKDDHRLIKKYREYLKENKYSELLDSWNGYIWKSDTGDYGYYHNPNAKWDWFQVGGRWAGYWKIKDDRRPLGRGEPSLLDKDHKYEKGTGDLAFKCDIDWEKMKGDPHKKELYWEACFENEKIHSKYKKDEKWSKEDSTKHSEILKNYGLTINTKYLLKTFKTKEKYAEVKSNFSSYAFLDLNGKWHQKGQMGWFGMGSESGNEEIEWEENFMKEFIEPLADNTILITVDCHI